MQTLSERRSEFETIFISNLFKNAGNSGYTRWWKPMWSPLLQAALVRHHRVDHADLLVALFKQLVQQAPVVCLDLFVLLVHGTLHLMVGDVDLVVVVLNDRRALHSQVPHLQLLVTADRGALELGLFERSRRVFPNDLRVGSRFRARFRKIHSLHMTVSLSEVRVVAQHLRVLVGVVVWVWVREEVVHLHRLHLLRLFVHLLDELLLPSLVFVDGIFIFEGSNVTPRVELPRFWSPSDRGFDDGGGDLA